MKSASQFWNGTPNQALTVLRAEYSYIPARAAAHLGSGSLSRLDWHAAALRGLPGSYGMRLGILLAAAPETHRTRVAEAFSAVLPVETAAEMRGVAAGTWYGFVVVVDDGEPQQRELLCDERGARELAEKAQTEAIAAGAVDVSVKFYRMAA